MLGLYCDALASHCGGFPCAPQTSVVAAHGLSCSMACGSSRTREQTGVSSIGRCATHCTTRETPLVPLANFPGLVDRERAREQG